MIVKISQNDRCENCGRKRPLIEYRLKNIKFDLCEDCSCAMSNMFFRHMENGSAQIYNETSERIITNKEGEIIEI